MKIDVRVAVDQSIPPKKASINISTDTTSYLDLHRRKGLGQNADLDGPGLRR